LLTFTNLIVVVKATDTFNIQFEPSIFEKVFIWFLGQPVVWSKPNISQIEAGSSTIYAWYQKFEFDFFFEFQTEEAKIIYKLIYKKF
jgi:hypothetical protein